MARIVVAGAGAIGANIAYHLAQRGASDVVLADRAGIASGRPGGRWAGCASSSRRRREVTLARESIGFFEELGLPFFDQVGYVFVATTEKGLAELEARAELQRGLGVPVESVDASRISGLNTEDVLGALACWQDGVAEPAEVTRELVRRAAELGVEVHEHVDARELGRDILVIAAGAHSPELWPELPIRPLCRQLVEVGPVAALPPDLPMILESESGFHFRRHGDTLRLAMSEPRHAGPTARRSTRRSSRTGEAGSRALSAAGRAPVARAWAGLRDMTPDAHPIIGWVSGGRLRRVRLFGARVHAVTRGRQSGCGGTARRAWVDRPFAVPDREVRGRRDFPRRPRPLRPGKPRYP